MNRRGFLKGILAAGAAPYVVTTAGLLMPVRQIVVADLTEASLEQMVVDIYKRVNQGGFAAILRPGMEKIFSESYGSGDWPA